jgi:hypothetical protein
MEFHIFEQKIRIKLSQSPLRCAEKDELFYPIERRLDWIKDSALQQKAGYTCHSVAEPFWFVGSL